MFTGSALPHTISVAWPLSGNSRYSSAVSSASAVAIAQFLLWLSESPPGRTLVTPEHVGQGVHDLAHRAARPRGLHQDRHQVLARPGDAAHLVQHPPDRPLLPL